GRRARTRSWRRPSRYGSDDLEKLIRTVGGWQAGRLTSPSRAWSSKTISRILPSGAGVADHASIIPEPLSSGGKVLSRLHGNPIGARRQRYCGRKGDHRVRAVSESIGEARCDQSSR